MSETPSFKLILVDVNPEVTAGFKKHFSELPNIELVHGYFETLPEFDCMVSPANSFGLMDGGVDAAIIRFFGIELMHRVQKRIIDEYRGEQPVGTSMIVETGAKKHPFLAHTPTMRVPLDIRNTDNVYLAMWAMLRAVDDHNKTSEQKINSVACTGLGTAVGRVPGDEGARQMALAYKNFLNPPTFINWGYASKRQSDVIFGGNMRD
jgi:O-acetyl-ADP-ribose deacetylase (regulator of RNase III)